MAAILSGTVDIATMMGDDERYSPDDIAAYHNAYAPFTSCDVERSFSRYKTLLTDNRRSLTFENLRMIFVTNCNSVDTD